MPYQIDSHPRVTVFTPEAAKGRGLRAVQGRRGQALVFQMYGLPLHLCRLLRNS